MSMRNFLSPFLQRARILSSRDPERDWILLLIISIITLTGIVVWNIFVFDTVANGGVIGAPVTNTTPVFSQSSLDAIHTVFANRAAEETKYIGEGYHYADPSQ